MPRTDSPPRAIENITIGQLRRLVHGGLDEHVTIADALAALHEGDQAAAAHEAETRAFEAYRARREARRAAAIADAAAAADKAHRGHHDGARMAARQEARLEADELFARRSPNLDFREWVDLGRPDVHEVEVSVIRRAVEAVTGMAH